MTALYDDGRIVLDEQGVRIGWYYLWGAKKISYQSIRSITIFEVKVSRGKWRLWGSGDFVHWYNLDGSRPKKSSGIEIDAGGTVRPRITPDDVSEVARIIEAHLPSETT
jgi:hypothetical protein